jgi:hypothetical protein
MLGKRFGPRRTAVSMMDKRRDTYPLHETKSCCAPFPVGLITPAAELDARFLQPSRNRFRRRIGNSCSI